MSQKPQFSNHSLAKAYEKIEPALHARNQLLTALSQDISRLEENLSKAACPNGIVLEYKRTLDCEVLKSISNACFDEYYNRVICGQIIEKSFFLAWDKNPSGGNSRLLHLIEQKVFRVYFRNGGHPALEVWREEISKEQMDIRPLIECKVETRIEGADHLPTFLAHLGDVLGSSSKKFLNKSISEAEEEWEQTWKEEARFWHPLPEASSETQDISF